MDVHTPPNISNQAKSSANLYDCMIASCVLVYVQLFDRIEMPWLRRDNQKLSESPSFGQRRSS